ncbi:MAG TPA: branched-chain amino acid ABC transporter permease, partial [Anaerolineae bacterium]|nr:branched-chain amino acid ABC transporter permease [Anaerolineae bacterium]
SLVRGGLFALMAVGLSLVFGVMNIPHFAHGEFYMLGAYAAFFAYRKWGLYPLLVILIAGLIDFAVGAAVEKSVFYPLRRRSREGWIMNSFLLTVGLSFVLQNGVQAIWGAEYRGVTSYWKGALQIGSLGISVDRAVAFLIAIVSIVVFWFFLQRTRTGRAIRAVAQDETGAKLMGINIDNVQTLTFALSSMLAGIAGASLLSINPAYPTVGLVPLYVSWYVVILVGLGNVAAAIPGGFIVGLLQTLSSYYLGVGWQDAASLAIIIVILLVRPAGIFGSEVKGVWER